MNRKPPKFYWWKQANKLLQLQTEIIFCGKGKMSLRKEPRDQRSEPRVIQSYSWTGVRLIPNKGTFSISLAGFQ